MSIRHVIVEAHLNLRESKQFRKKAPEVPVESSITPAQCFGSFPEAICSLTLKQDILYRTAAIPLKSPYDGSHSLNVNGIMRYSLSGRNSLYSQRTPQVSDIKRDNGTSALPSQCVCGKKVVIEKIDQYCPVKTEGLIEPLLLLFGLDQTN
jgi:hypothetical protein